jgi:hypothetical protein
MSRSSLASLAAVDLRSLAALRIGLGALVFWDQAHALRNVQAFYSDVGLLPRHALLTEFASEASRFWSFHMLSGALSFQVALILVAMLAAVALMLGWRTRSALFLTWLLTASLQSRNPGILYGADTVLRVLQFWCLFLPMGARWSVDAEAKQTQWLSLGSLALMLQISFIYWFTAALKYGPEWSRDGTAIYYALSADQFTQGLGHWLLQQPTLCRWLTHAVWWLEISCPFLVFLPWRSGLARSVAVLSMVGMHLGLAACMRIGYFPVVMMLCWLIFLPSAFWDWAESMLPRISLPMWLGLHRRPAFAPWQSAVATQCCIAVMLTAVLVLNVTSLWERQPAWLSRALELVRLDQHWALFGPSPISDDGWLVLEGQTYGGQLIDLQRPERPLSGEKPSHLASEYPDWKWQKLHACLAFPQFKAVAARYADSVANEWSQQAPQQQRIRSWRLWWIKEKTLPNYQSKPLQRFTIAENKQFQIIGLK